MLLVCLIWGINFSVTKLAIAQIRRCPSPRSGSSLASVLLWLVLRALEGPAGPAARGDVRRLVVLGVVGNTLYQLAFVLGLACTSATNSSLILATVPTVVAVVAGVLGIERITRRMWWIGIALGTLGVVLRHRRQRRGVLHGHPARRPAHGAGRGLLGRLHRRAAQAAGRLQSAPRDHR